MIDYVIGSIPKDKTDLFSVAWEKAADAAICFVESGIEIAMNRYNSPRKKTEEGFLEEERNRMSSEDQARITVSIKADRDVPMGIITDIKKALQQDYALRINYSATERSNPQQDKRPPSSNN